MSMSIDHGGENYRHWKVVALEILAGVGLAIVAFGYLVITP